jgi:hypothetical protein
MHQSGSSLLVCEVSSRFQRLLVFAFGPSVVHDSIERELGEEGQGLPRQCYLSTAYSSKTFN